MALMIIDHTAADGRVTTHHGTAFFISEKLLLTAGHNIFASPNVKVKLRITIPGTPYFQESGVGSRNSGPTIDCKLVGTLYKNQNVPWHHDIAILDAGTYNASSYVRLSSELTSLPAKVNVIGFPGNVSWGWLRCHEGLADVPVNRRATDDMFPANRMTITSGQVESLGQTISYKLSTTPGMSGGCVLYNGYAIGKSYFWFALRFRSSYWPAL
jgi:V8-like Glu-specific endopeptidase